MWIFLIKSVCSEFRDTDTPHTTDQENHHTHVSGTAKQQRQTAATARDEATKITTPRVEFRIRSRPKNHLVAPALVLPPPFFFITFVCANASKSSSTRSRAASTLSPAAMRGVEMRIGAMGRSASEDAASVLAGVQAEWVLANPQIILLYNRPHSRRLQEGVFVSSKSQRTI